MVPHEQWFHSTLHSVNSKIAVLSYRLYFRSRSLWRKIMYYPSCSCTVKQTFYIFSIKILLKWSSSLMKYILTNIHIINKTTFYSVHKIWYNIGSSSLKKLWLWRCNQLHVSMHDYFKDAMNQKLLIRNNQSSFSCTCTNDIQGVCLILLLVLDVRPDHIFVTCLLVRLKILYLLFFQTRIAQLLAMDAF